MTKALVKGPSGLVVETEIVDRWESSAGSFVLTNFGTFRANPSNGVLEWVRNPGYVLNEKEATPCPPSNNA